MPEFEFNRENVDRIARKFGGYLDMLTDGLAVINCASKDLTDELALEVKALWPEVIPQPVGKTLVISLD